MESYVIERSLILLVCVWVVVLKGCYVCEILGIDELIFGVLGYGE